MSWHEATRLPFYFIPQLGKQDADDVDDAWVNRHRPPRLAIRFGTSFKRSMGSRARTLREERETHRTADADVPGGIYARPAYVRERCVTCDD